MWNHVWGVTKLTILVTVQWYIVLYTSVFEKKKGKERRK